jgi:hypothetical protein
VTLASPPSQSPVSAARREHSGSSRSSTRCMTSMQRQTAAPRGGLETRGLLALISRLWGVPSPRYARALDPARARYPLRLPEAPSAACRNVSRGARPEQAGPAAFLWSASEAVLAMWLTRRPADGLDVSAFRRPLRGPGWSNPGGDLTRDPPPFLAISSGGTAAVLERRMVPASIHIAICWPAQRGNYDAGSESRAIGLIRRQQLTEGGEKR